MNIRQRPRSLLLAVSLGLLLDPAAANAAFVSAELRVNGLSCPFCAFGIEKKLLDVDGVTDVEVFLDDGRLALQFESENAATIADLERAVEKAGFELTALKLTVRGHLAAEEEGGPRLVANSRMRFQLVERRGGAMKSISTDTILRLLESTGQGAGSTLVSGVIGDRDEEEPTLVVESAETPPR